jgi:cytochrome c553
MTLPAVEELEAAVAAGDRDAFTAAYDRLTTACNDCHVAAGRGAIVIQRPTAPPLTNLRYAPGPAD